MIYKIFFVLFIIFIPFQSRWIFFDHLLNNQIWEYGRLSLYASFILLLFLALLNFKKFFQKFDKKFWQNKIIIAWSLLFIYLVINCLLSPLKDVSFYLLSFFLGASLFFLVLEKTEKKIIYFSLLFSGAIQGVFAIWQTIHQAVSAQKYLGIAQHLPQDLGASVVEYDLDRILRAYGSLPHPNILGGFLVICALAGLWTWLYVYLQAKKENWRGPQMKFLLLQLLFVLLSLISIIFGLLFSFSRSAIIALIVALIFIFIQALWQKQWLKMQVSVKVLLLVFVLAVFVGFLFPGVWQARFLSSGRLEQKSLSERVTSFQQIDWHNYQELFLGQGLGANTAVYLAPDQAPYEVQPIHNFFLLSLAEIGLVGWALLCYFIVTLFSQRKIKLLNVWLLVFLVLALFDHYLWTMWSGWLILVLLTYFATQQKS